MKSPILAAVSTAWLPVRRWWQTLGLRERRLLLGAGAALVVIVLWMAAVQPAWRTLASTPAQLDALDLQWQNMQKLAAEAGELRSATPTSLEQSTAALKAATERLGESGRLSIQGERAVLTLNSVSTSQLRDWLNEARSAARARPVDATLSRAADGYSGTVVVAIGGAL